jgi:ABC-type phosphate transport system substrate-binding protein
MKKIIAIISTAIILLTSCGSLETAESITTSATTTAAATFETTTTAAITLTETTTSTTAPIYEPKITLPVIDGSTSTIPLHAYIKTKLIGGIYSEIRDRTVHSKTFESFDKLLAGEADVILTVPITPEQRVIAENTEGFTLGEEAIALEGFVFIVNPENPVKSLTQAQIRDIYSGKITNWAEVGGDDAEIIAYQRNETSGSQSYMNEFMGETPLADAPTTMVISEMGYMVETVADYTNGKYAIGYSVYSYAASRQVSAGNVALLSIDGILPSRESFSDGSYPLLSQTMLYYNEEIADEDTLAFRDFLISDEGQLTVLEAGYLPISEIEIPVIYAVYNEKGTGKEKSDDKGRPTEYSFFEYTENLYVEFLADKELEATVNEWIDANISEGFRYTTLEIYNGYLSVVTHGSAAVWDLYTCKKIENFNDLFYKDTPMYPIIDAATLVAVDSDINSYSFLKCDYFGFLGKTEDFSATLFSLPSENAYFTMPMDIPLLLYLEENSIISEYRDSQQFLVDGKKQEIIKIPPYERADYVIESDNRDCYYFQIKSDTMPTDEVTRINAGLMKACDTWREKEREFDSMNMLGYSWHFEVVDDTIRFYNIYSGEMIFDLDGNFIMLNHIETIE